MGEEPEFSGLAYALYKSAPGTEVEFVDVLANTNIATVREAIEADDAQGDELYFVINLNNGRALGTWEVNVEIKKTVTSVHPVGMTMPV